MLLCYYIYAYIYIYIYIYIYVYIYLLYAHIYMLKTKHLFPNELYFGFFQTFKDSNLKSQDFRLENWTTTNNFNTLSQYPSWNHPGKFPVENLFRKITPRKNSLGFFTFPTILHNLFHPGKNITLLTVLGECLDITRWFFYITPVILLIRLRVWQHLTGITAMRGNC